MKSLSFKRITPSDGEYDEVFALRDELLRSPIGLSLLDEDLSDEVNDHILTAWMDNELAACLILSPKANNTVQLRQMAVAEALQGQNVGRQLVVYAEQFAWENGYDCIVLHARTVAQEFYKKQGYTQTSDVFTEVGIPHVKMEKRKP